ncbi:hypothetical protein [Jiangella mangrovi]|uniref:PBP domain-containing protein n=1 Tax=Jiangella mangrovi TaxID=1524084 RepID=A0A7W9GV00_9ACTN|nr:hypothetical protein [Jiangella mangrovi]MBB5790562.1 hypothetical protein [Jiangella mangrovi]
MIISSGLRIRAVSAALALVAGVGLLAYEPATPTAGAAAGDLTDSAVTLRWSDGIIGADHSTVVEERDPEHFMYDDFDGLEVTVSQTDDIRAQSLDVRWSGWQPTPGSVGSLPGNYMQIMQCWGDEETGPLPENCVWGAPGMSDPGRIEPSVRGRGVEPTDPLAESVPDHYIPPGGGVAEVPFRAADSDEFVWSADIENVFGRWTTNEVRGVRTDDAGDGEAIFTVQDAIDAPYLGCGTPVEGAQADGRDCWLVVVPHGGHRLDGSAIGTGTNALQYADGSPLTPTNWAQRIQVRLDFASVDLTCPTESEQRPTVGSQLAARAVFSWLPELCSADGGAFSYLALSDAEGRRQVASDTPGAAGLAFTYAPVVTGEEGPEVLHAPVAVSGLVIALNIEEPDGTIVRDLRLTPRLVAKLLTQSYRHDVPGGYEAFTGLDEPPAWAVANPTDISADPEFTELNPEAPVRNLGFAAGNALRISGPNPADAFRELWRWIQADAEASAWLAGEPDDHGMVVNPAYEELGLAEPPAPDTVPRDVQACYQNTTQPQIPAPGYCTLDLLFFATSFEDAALRARLGQAGSKTDWDTLAVSPSGTPGWWTEIPPQAPGRRWQLAVTDSASAQLYGLPVASLRNAAGEFVQPGSASLAAAVDSMVPSEIDDVLAIDPEAADPDAYPLAMITYAAVRADQEDDALADYSAMLSYAAGDGQTPGLAAGDLPPGYSPLNDELRAQTLAVAEALVATDDPRDPPGLVPGSDEDGGDEDGAEGNGDGGDEAGGTEAGGPGSTGADDGAPGAGDAPDPAGLAPTGGDDPTDDPSLPPAPDGATGGAGDDQPPAVGDDVPVAQTTPGEPVGPMQYVLLAVLIAGLLGATAGPALLKLGPRFGGAAAVTPR